MTPQRPDPQWPVAESDDLARFRALAAGIRHAHVTEGTVEAPFDRVWSLIDDLEGAFGLIEPDMRGVRVRSREGDRVEALAVSRWGMRALLRGTLRPGRLWLQSRFLLIGVAAVPEGPQRTRVAFTGGPRLPGRAALAPFGIAWAGRRSLAALKREAES